MRNPPTKRGATLEPPPPKKKGPPPKRRVQGATRQAQGIKPKEPRTRSIAPKPDPETDGPEVYYDHQSLVFWFRDENGEFTRMNESAVRQHMHIAGFDNERRRGNPSDIDEAIAKIRLTKKIDYVGRLAGYPIGYWTIYGRRLLITREARLAELSPTDDETVRDFVVRLLGAEQADVVFSWTKCALEARRAGIDRLRAGLPPNFRAGQYLGIAGDPDHGKTVLSRILVWAISSLDEMKGDLSQFHKGQTTFNADGAKHETHVIDDEGGSDSPTGRREMLESIKKGTGQQEKRVHGKGQDGETLELFNRTIILLNRGIADLRILPEVEDEGISTKIHLLKTVTRAVECDTTNIDAFNDYFDALRAAVPGFIRFLDAYEVPEELRGGRFGMRHYHNPELLLDLSELSTTTDFWEVIDSSELLVPCDVRNNSCGLVERYDGVFRGTTGQLFSALLAGDTKQRLLTLAKNSAAFGKIVHAAADQHAKFPAAQRRIKRLGRSHGSPERFEITRPTE